MVAILVVFVILVKGLIPWDRAMRCKNIILVCSNIAESESTPAPCETNTPMDRAISQRDWIQQTDIWARDDFFWDGPLSYFKHLLHDCQDPPLSRIRSVLRRLRSEACNSHWAPIEYINCSINVTWIIYFKSSSWDFGYRSRVNIKYKWR